MGGEARSDAKTKQNEQHSYARDTNSARVGKGKTRGGVGVYSMGLAGVLAAAQQDKKQNVVGEDVRCCLNKIRFNHRIQEKNK